MRRRISITILLIVLVLALGATAAQAQTNGAIRGTLYNDTNADGVCGQGDPTISGVPVGFTHEGGNTVTLTSGSDGTYGLVSAALGTWSVAAVPLQGWQTTSPTPIIVTLTAEQNLAQNINFCLTQVTATQPLPPTPTPIPPATLPESGADVPPTLLVAAILGAALLVAGVGLIARDRRTAD